MYIVTRKQYYVGSQCPRRSTLYFPFWQFVGFILGARSEQLVFKTMIVLAQRYLVPSHTSRRIRIAFLRLQPCVSHKENVMFSLKMKKIRNLWEVWCGVVWYGMVWCGITADQHPLSLSFFDSQPPNRPEFKFRDLRTSYDVANFLVKTNSVNLFRCLCANCAKLHRTEMMHCIFHERFPCQHFLLLPNTCRYFLRMQ